MLIYPLEISQTASSGAWSFNTPKMNSSLLKQIIVEPATSTTTFTFTITNNKGNTVFTTETKATGNLSREVEIPLKDICTIAVSGSSADELFTGKLMIEEIGD